MRIADLMVEPVVVASEETTLAELAETMLARKIGGIPIVDDRGVVVGIVTESDFVGSMAHVPLAFPTVRLPNVLREWMEEGAFEHIVQEARNTPVREIMSAPVHTAEEDEPVQAVVERMIEHEVGRIPIVRDGRPVGIVSRHDVLKVVAGSPDATS